jgi:hypothetical protein
MGNLTMYGLIVTKWLWSESALNHWASWMTFKKERWAIVTKTTKHGAMFRLRIAEGQHVPMDEGEVILKVGGPS